MFGLLVLLLLLAAVAEVVKVKVSASAVAGKRNSANAAARGIILLKVLAPKFDSV